jgi:hypothetical protein
MVLLGWYHIGGPHSLLPPFCSAASSRKQTTAWTNIPSRPNVACSSWNLGSSCGWHHWITYTASVPAHKIWASRVMASPTPWCIVHDWQYEIGQVVSAGGQMTMGTSRAVYREPHSTPGQGWFAERQPCTEYWDYRYCWQHQKAAFRWPVQYHRICTFHLSRIYYDYKCCPHYDANTTHSRPRCTWLYFHAQCVMVISNWGSDHDNFCE